MYVSKKEKEKEVRSSIVNCKENIISMTISILEMVFKGEIPLKIYY